MKTVMAATRRTATAIGLDIGAHGVRAVQCTGGPDRWTVSGMAHSEFKGGTAGGEKSGPGAAQLRTCLQRAPFRGQKVVTALGMEHLEYHPLELPDAITKGNADVGEAVKFEVERLMTLPEGAVETRHWLLPESSVPAPNAVGVAARRPAVIELIERCDEAGLQCVGVDCAATALARLGAVLRPPRSEEVWGVLDLGATQSRIVICVDALPVIARPIAAGGEAWTQLIAESLELSPKSAEIHKCERGIAPPGSGDRRDEPEDAQTELASLLLGALRSELNRLAGGIKQSYEYALSCYPGRSAGDLILTGGGAGLSHLDDFLSQSLGITVQAASTYLDSPESRLTFGATRRHALQTFGMAVGLCLPAES